MEINQALSNNPIKMLYLKIGLAALVIGAFSALLVVALSPLYSPFFQLKGGCINDPSALFCLGFYAFLGIALTTAISVVSGLILGLALGFYLQRLQINHPWLISLICCVMAPVVTPFLGLSLGPIVLRLAAVVSFVLVACYLFGHTKAPLTNLDTPPVQAEPTAPAKVSLTTTLPSLSQSLFLAFIAGLVVTTCLIIPFFSIFAFIISLTLIYQILKRQHLPQPGLSTALTIILIIVSFVSIARDNVGWVLLLGINSQDQPYLYYLLFTGSAMLAQLIIQLFGKANHQITNNTSPKGALAILDDKTNLVLFIFGCLGLTVTLIFSWIKLHYGSNGF